MHHLFLFLAVILQKQKGRPFVAAHSVTQTQDLRLPVIQWKRSLFTALTLLMLTYFTREKAQTGTRRPALHVGHN